MNLTQQHMDQLRLLAQKNGVSTSFWGWDGREHHPKAESLIAILADIGVPIEGLRGALENGQLEEAGIWLEKALVWTDDQPWLETVPACTVVQAQSSRQIPIHVPHGQPVKVRCVSQTHQSIELEQVDLWVPPRQVGTELLGRATFLVPHTLSTGIYHLQALVGESEEVSTGVLYVVPTRSTALDGKDNDKARWGVAAQAYSVLSKRSWGIGDAADMADLVAFCADQEADFVLVNPLHAAEPITPVENSPYLPVSRRWLNLSYIRPQAIPEYAVAPASVRQKIAALQTDSWPETIQTPETQFYLDRDTQWTAKKAALELLFSLPLSIARSAQFEAFERTHGQDLDNYGLWCALVEHYGSTVLPEAVGDAQRAQLSDLAGQLRPRIQFFKWCQWIAWQQLRQITPMSKQLGMSIGLMTDLAVGVHRFGEEYWADPDLFATRTSVGAPPDMYSQKGQNWSQPPWNPRALYARAYKPYIELLRSVMEIAGAVRIDHILGLFRLWWIPNSAGNASEGAYVNYDHEALVGLLLLLAEEYGVAIIGEDLGTVEPWVRSYLSDRGILGTSVLWFEKEEGGQILAAENYRRDILAAVNTHDLPPTLGYLAGVHTALRSDLGLLVREVSEEKTEDQRQIDAVRETLVQSGCLDRQNEHVEWEVMKALHRYIAKSPARLLAVSLMDVVGQKMPQNLPGTHLEYANWKVPLENSQGQVVSIDDLVSDPQYQQLFALMRQQLD